MRATQGRVTRGDSIRKLRWLPDRRLGCGEERREANLESSCRAIELGELPRTTFRVTRILRVASRDAHDLAVAQRAAGVASLAAVEGDDATLWLEEGVDAAAPPRSRLGNSLRRAYITAVAAGGRAERAAPARVDAHVRLGGALPRGRRVAGVRRRAGGGGMSQPKVINKHRVVQSGLWAPKGASVRSVWAVCSDAGCSLDGARKTNQDSYMVSMPDASAPEVLFGVFDGHGEHGHLVSRQCKAQFPALLKTARQQRPDLASAQSAAYVEQDHACTVSIDCSQSGTTAVTCLLQVDDGGGVVVHSAWAGDSRAVRAAAARRHARGEGPLERPEARAPRREGARARRPRPAPPARPPPPPLTCPLPFARRESSGRAAWSSPSSTSVAAGGSDACGTSLRWRPASRCRARLATRWARWSA